jgi:hypothetical protein
MNTTTTTQAVRSLCTPAQHAQADKSKPVMLLALMNDGPHGKAALVEFPGGWQRTIDLLTQFDGWHPLFSDLPQDDRQRLRDHAIPAFVNHPDGTRSRPDPLSFVRQVQNARGKFLHWNYFDVPAQDYAEGAVTGYRCAAELLAVLELGHGPHTQLQRVLENVAQAAGEGFNNANRRAAAVAFLEIVGQALNFFADRTNHRTWLAEKIDRAEQYARDTAECRAMERAGFAQRMKVAKAAKRKERETTSERMAA